MNMLFSLAKMSSGSIEAIIGIIITVVVILIILATPILLIALNLLISYKLSTVAAMKGHRPIWAFILCFVFGIPGYFYVAALPDLTKRHQLEKIIGIIQTEEENPEEVPAAKEEPAPETPAEV